MTRLYMLAGVPMVIWRGGPSSGTGSHVAEGVPCWLWISGSGERVAEHIECASVRVMDCNISGPPFHLCMGRRTSYCGRLVKLHFYHQRFHCSRGMAELAQRLFDSSPSKCVSLGRC